MAAIPITPQIPDDAQNTSQLLRLDEVNVQIVTKWVTPAAGWFLDVFDANGDPLVQGVRIVTGIDLWAPYKYKAGIPPGALFVQWQRGGNAQDPGEDSFKDGDALMFYAEAT